MCNLNYIIKFVLAAYTATCLVLSWIDFSQHKYVLAKAVKSSMEPSSVPRLHHGDSLYKVSNLLFDVNVLSDYTINGTNETIGDCTNEWIAIEDDWQQCNEFTYVICTNTQLHDENLKYSNLHPMHFEGTINDIIAHVIEWGFFIALGYTVFGITMVFFMDWKEYRNDKKGKQSSNYRQINNGSRSKKFFDRLQDGLWKKCMSVLGHYGCAGVILPIFTMDYGECAMPKWNMSFTWFMYYWQVCCYIFVISFFIVSSVCVISCLYGMYICCLKCFCYFVCCHEYRTGGTTTKADTFLTCCFVFFGCTLFLTIISSTLLGFVITFFDYYGKFCVGLSMSLLTLTYFVDLFGCCNRCC